MTCSRQRILQGSLKGCNATRTRDCIRATGRELACICPAHDGFLSDWVHTEPFKSRKFLPYIRTRGAGHGKRCLTLLEPEQSPQDVRAGDRDNGDDDEAQGNDPKLCQLARRQRESDFGCQKGRSEHIVVLRVGQAKGRAPLECPMSLTSATAARTSLFRDFRTELVITPRRARMKPSTETMATWMHDSATTTTRAA